MTSEQPDAAPPLRVEKPTRVRWGILTMLTGFSCVSYMQRINISIAAELMGPELHLDKVQFGQIFSSFLIGYAIFQIPGGIFADRFGTRLTLALSAALWAVCTVVTGMLPTASRSSAGSIFILLWLVRFLLGSAEATTYPVGALAVHNWIRPPERALANSWMFAGTSLAAACTSPFVSWLMLRLGWRWVFFVTSVPALVISLLWWLFSTDKPSQHRSINKAELALTNTEVEQPPTLGGFGLLLRNPRMILLCCSYIAEGYLLFIFVFWLYIYLVDVRGFSMMSGGLVAALPWLAGLCFTPLGGRLASHSSWSPKRGQIHHYDGIHAEWRTPLRGRLRIHTSALRGCTLLQCWLSHGFRSVVLGVGHTPGRSTGRRCLWLDEHGRHSRRHPVHVTCPDSGCPLQLDGRIWIGNAGFNTVCVVVDPHRQRVRGCAILGVLDPPLTSRSQV